MTQTEALPFSHTKYYSDEMGNTLHSKMLFFQKNINLDEVYFFKIQSNNVEQQFLQSSVCRSVNIDPCYMTLSKICLLTTKNYSHRLYLKNSIYAEITLYYKNGMWHTLPWTYSDYASSLMRGIFYDARTAAKILLDNYKKVKEIAVKWGASSFGVAALTDYKFKFKEFNGYNYGISCVVRLSDGILKTLKTHATALYSYHYRRINFVLDQMATHISTFIQNSGSIALPIPASQFVDWSKMLAHIAHIDVARKAGPRLDRTK